MTHMSASQKIEQAGQEYLAGAQVGLQIANLAQRAADLTHLPGIDQTKALMVRGAAEVLRDVATEKLVRAK